MQSDFDIAVSEDGKIIDFLDGTFLEATPEEFVRQRFLRILHFEYLYPKQVMRREVPIFHGSSELKDASGAFVRADIVVYDSTVARNARDQGRILLVVECKAPNETTGYNQLVSYIYNTSASGGVWFNGSADVESIQYFRRLEKPNPHLEPWIGIPRKGESWQAIARRKKDDLIRPKDIKGVLRRCHSRLHGRGADGEEEDLTMDMVRIILAKAQDEELPDDLPSFYCTPEEYATEVGRALAAKRVDALFQAVKELNPGIFAPHEEITVSDRSICDVMVELQNFRLMSDLNAASDWDLMGHAYEEYTAAHLRRVRGQFFTNRLVIDFLIAAIAPTYTDIILDPAGGSGGFLSGAIRFIRNAILSGAGGKIAKQRQLDRLRQRLFMVEASKRLVKVAKTSMILNGDGHTGMTSGDSLGPYDQFNEKIVSQAGKGVPTIILTNPPFAGVGDGKITQQEVLEQF
jgi:type I restriction enzyme M protein